MMRLDKFLSHHGFGTRKEVKLLIKEKRVVVNGELVKKEDLKIDENKDCVQVDNESIEYHEFHYFILNKPQGVISATEDPHKKTVIDLVSENIPGLFPVGRLDIDTEGLLLICDDGDLAHQLLSPKKHVEKCYYLEIKNPITKEHITQIENGIWLNEQEQCKPARVELIDDHSLKLYIVEGKFHQVKRMMIACGSEVVYLKRLSMGPLVLDESLQLGECRRCKEEEIQALLEYKK